MDEMDFARASGSPTPLPSSWASIYREPSAFRGWEAGAVAADSKNRGAAAGG